MVNSLRHVVFIAALPCTFAWMACGGSAAVAVPDDGGEPQPSLAPDASSNSAPEDGGSPNDPQVSDAKPSLAPDAAPDAHGPQLDPRLDPIEVGHAWTYNVNVLGYYPSCENGIGVATTLSKAHLDGKTAFQVQSLCKNAGTFQYAVENDRVFYRDLGAWHLATDEPVQVGHAWNDDTYDYAWENAGTQITPAGTFSDCWTARRDLAYASFTTFCRGIGPVHWHYEDGFGNGYDAILTSKNF